MKKLFKSDENLFFGEDFAKFMSIGYNFKSSLKECFQLHQNLFRDAYHLGSIKKLEKKIGMPHMIEVLWIRIFDAFVRDTKLQQEQPIHRQCLLESHILSYFKVLGMKRQAYQEWSVSKLLNANIIHRLMINKFHQNKLFF